MPETILGEERRGAAKRVAALIVRMRVPLMVIVLICAVLAATAMDKAAINYDLTSYLSEDTDTKRAVRIMSSEFESTSSLSVVLDGISQEQAAAYSRQISAFDGVIRAQHDPQNGLRTLDGVPYRMLDIIMTTDMEEQVLQAVENLFAGMPHRIMSTVKDMRDLRVSISREIPVVMLVSCLIVLGVLVFMSRSWLEPLLFLVVISVSILLNMGTNWLFDSISFITFAVAAILQLALAMDYSIMLMNNYDRLRDKGIPAQAAMTDALAASFMPVASSAMTTVAGMVSLVFMSFTIGFDIGIVLAKGIVMSMLTVFLLMPGLLVWACPLLRRTAHKPVRLGGRHIPKASWGTKGILPVALIVLIIAGAAIQRGNVYTYTMRDIDDDSRFVTALFGQTNQAVLLFPRCESDADYAKQRDMLRRIGEITVNGKPVLRDAYAMVTTGADALAYHDAASVAAMMNINETAAGTLFAMMGARGSVRADELVARAAALAEKLPALMPPGAQAALGELQQQLALAEATFNGENWSRAIISLDLDMGDNQTGRVVDDIRGILRDTYGGQSALGGMLTAMQDIADSFSEDILRVSFITIAAVFIIVLLSFRRIVVPVILVCVIQGAIWINMALSGLLDGSVFFMCYLICVALQMGATIDYGILLTDHYIVCRRDMDKRAAIAGAMERSLQTILTSGLALIVAGFTVGEVSSVFYISSIGVMLGRGALISVALVLLLLPQLLIWFDGAIVRSKRTNAAPIDTSTDAAL